MIYVPFTDFQSSARCLDNALLGKMRWHVRDILIDNLYKRNLRIESLTKETAKWSGFEFSLVSYGFELCREWKLRGNICCIEAQLMDLNQLVKCKLPPEPDWLFDNKRIQFERKQLIERLPTWYLGFFNANEPISEK